LLSQSGYNLTAQSGLNNAENTNHTPITPVQPSTCERPLCSCPQSIPEAFAQNKDGGIRITGYLHSTTANRTQSERSAI